MQIIGIVVSCWLLAALGWRMVLGIRDTWCVLVIALAWIPAWMMADLTTGLVHWACDRLGSINTPLVGPMIRDFREHHVAPQKILECDAIGTMGNAAIGGAVLLPLVYFFYPDVTNSGFKLFGLSVLTFFFCGAVLTNEFHRWAHMDKPPRVARLLQWCGVILRPTHHDIHHRSAFDTHYCITVGWLNPLLRAIRFFEGIEWLILKTTGRHCAQTARMQEESMRRHLQSQRRSELATGEAANDAAIRGQSDANPTAAPAECSAALPRGTTPP